MEAYFKRISDTEWIETNEGLPFAHFKLVEKTDEHVILRKTDGLYVRLSSTNTSFTYKLYDFQVYNRGKWIF
jgi:hypothetical protein